MKARIPKTITLTEKQWGNQINEHLQRWIKLTCVVLNREFGLGHDRLVKFLGDVSAASAEKEHDEIYWKHVDDIVIKELGLPFEKENYEGLDK